MPDNLQAMVGRIRAVEFSGRFPAALARVLEIYLELAERPAADLDALAEVILVAVANAKVMEEA